MKFGIVNTIFMSEPGEAAALGVLVEQAGFESIWTVEHVVVPVQYESRYPYARSGKMPGREETPLADPLIWLTWLAAHTTTLKLATGVLILPQRNPLILAKEVATLDRLSGGRVMLGVGVGWLKEEFDALGAEFSNRGARTDEYISVLRELWAEREASFRGRWIDFDPVRMFPKPDNTTSVPIHVGGHSPAAARRAGRLGDGYYPTTTDLTELASRFALARSTAQEAGRDPDAIEMTCAGARDLAGVEQRAELGADRILIPLLGPTIEDCKRQVGEFAEQVIGKL